MVRLYVHLSRELDAVKISDAHAAGKTPDRVAYGFHHAENYYPTVVYSTDHGSSPVVDIFRRILWKLIKIDFAHAWQNRKSIDAADVVWTMLEHDYMAVIMLGLIRPWAKRPIVIAQNVWLFNTIEQINPLLRAFYLSLARRSDLQMTHSAACLPVMAAALPGVRTHLMYFGISGDSFPMMAAELKRPRSDGKIRIVAAGNDKTRDWTTLLAAYGNDDRFDLTIVCQRLPDSLLGQYTNLTLPRNPSMSDFSRLYREADFVVVPMVPNRFSGITVALEATAAGTPLICSATGGVPTYFAEDACIFVPPGDRAAMRDAALTYLGEAGLEIARQAQNMFLARDYTTRGMISRYAALTAELLGAREEAKSASPLPRTIEPEF